MPLASQTFRRVGDQTVSSVNVENYLDAIHAAAAATTYHDGAGRTAGSGRAWSAVKSGTPTDNVVLTPPSGSGCSARIIFAGFNGAKTPKMASPDTYLSNALHCLVSSNGGTLTTWDGTGSNDPLGANIRHTGYTRCSAACSSTGIVCFYESTEMLVVMTKVNTSWYGIVVGALWDAYSTDTLDAETDGRLYGYLTSGSTAIGASFDSTTAANTWTGTHGGTAGNNHAQYLQPGTSTLRNIARETHRGSSVAGMGKLASAKWSRIPTWYRDDSTDNTIGELRGIRRVTRGRQRQVVSSGGAISMFLIGGSDTADQDVLGLLYV